MKRKAFLFISIIMIITGITNFFIFAITSLNYNSDEFSPYAISLFFTFPMAMIGIFYIFIAYIFPSFIYGEKPEILKQKTEKVIHSGLPIQTENFAGFIGGVRFKGYMIKVTIYPDGITIKPRFMSVSAVNKLDIISLKKEHRWFGDEITIEHLSKSVKSPIILRRKNIENFYIALECLEG